MTAIVVDPAALHGLAQRIRQTAALAAAPDRGALQPAVAALSTPGLVHAVGTFIERWGVVLAELVDEAHRLADAIELAARTYQDADSLTEPGGLR